MNQDSYEALCQFCTRLTFNLSRLAHQDYPASFYKEKALSSFKSTCKMCEMISLYLAESEGDVGLDGWRKTKPPMLHELQPTGARFSNASTSVSSALFLAEKDGGLKYTKPLHFVTWAHSCKILEN